MGIRRGAVRREDGLGDAGGPGREGSSLQMAVVEGRVSSRVSLEGQLRERECRRGEMGRRGEEPARVGAAGDSAQSSAVERRSFPLRRQASSNTRRGQERNRLKHSHYQLLLESQLCTPWYRRARIPPQEQHVSCLNEQVGCTAGPSQPELHWPTARSRRAPPGGGVRARESLTERAPHAITTSPGAILQMSRRRMQPCLSGADHTK